MPALTVVYLVIPGKIQRKRSNEICHLLIGYCCFRKQRVQQTRVQNVQPEENGIANYKITYSTMSINFIPPPHPQTTGSQKSSPQPAASISSGNLLEIQILRSHLRPIESKILGMRSSDLCFNKP